MQKNVDKIADTKKYLVPDRFREHKKRMKKRIDCRNDVLAEKMGIQVRQFQNYIGGEKPIPEDCLHALCDYMNVSPRWLTGEKDEFATLRGLESEEAHLIFDDVRLSGRIEEYLVDAGTQSPDRVDLYTSTDPDTGKLYTDITTDGTENPYFKYREVNGVVLSYNEYQALLTELRLVIDFAADRFVKNIVASRNGFE